MPVIYETTATIAENGHLLLDIDDLPFDKGTEFLVKLIPQSSLHPETFKRRMQALIDECAKNTPYKGMSTSQILAELRRQREDMFSE
ncbi:MAG: hypothetical protein GY801_38975 [bacterium]|nr:hypothetical protein [bacterium]